MQLDSGTPSIADPERAFHRILWHCGKAWPRVVLLIFVLLCKKDSFSRAVLISDRDEVNKLAYFNQRNPLCEQCQYHNYIPLCKVGHLYLTQATSHSVIQLSIKVPSDIWGPRCPEEMSTYDTGPLVQH